MTQESQIDIGMPDSLVDGGFDGSQLGFADSDALTFRSGDGIIPQYNHASFIKAGAEADTLIDEDSLGVSQPPPRAVARPMAQHRDVVPPAPILHKLGGQPKTMIIDDVAPPRATAPPAAASHSPSAATSPSPAAAKAPMAPVAAAPLPAKAKSLSPPPSAAAAAAATAQPPNVGDVTPTSPTPQSSAAAEPKRAAQPAGPHVVDGAEQRALLRRLARDESDGSSAAAAVANDKNQKRKLDDDATHGAKLIRGEPRERRAAIQVTHMYDSRSSMPAPVKEVFKQLWQQNVREGFVKGSRQVVFTVNYKIEARQDQLGDMQY